MSIYLFSISLFISGIGLTNAFSCYQCSYDVTITEEWNKKECVDKPESLDAISVFPCNDTGYCIYQEMFDIHSRIVTSYARWCSKTSLGNECTEDATRLTCFGSCQGNFCNKNDTGYRYMKYYENNSSSLHKYKFHTSLIFLGVFFVYCKLI